MIEAQALSKLPAYLPLPEFARIVRLTTAEVQSKIEAGEINAATISDQVIIPYREMDKLLPRELLPEYQEHAHLKGTGIGMGQAGKKYGIATPIITSWVKRDLIRVLGSDPEHSQRVLIDESDIAYCALIYHRNPGRGRKLFNANGTPYKVKFIRARKPSANKSTNGHKPSTTDLRTVVPRTKKAN